MRFVQQFRVLSTFSFGRRSRSTFSVVVALLASGLTVGAARAQSVPLSYQGVVSGLSPLAYWPLDGGSGAAVTGPGLSVAGSAVGSPLGGGVGVSGTSVGVADLNRSESMSASVWMKFPAAGSFVAAPLVSMPGWVWSLNADGKGGTVSVKTVYDVSNAGFSLPYSLHDGLWHHLVLLNDSVPGYSGHSSAYVYLDGMRVAGMDVSFGGSPKYDPTVLLPFEVTGVRGPGEFDEIAVWDRVITADEAARLYFGVRSCPDPLLSPFGTDTAATNPLTYWSLDGAAQGAVANNSASGGLCRAGSGAPGVTSTSGIGGAGSGLTRPDAGVIFSGSDAGLDGSSSMGWWFSLPSTLAAGSSRVLVAGGGAITVDLSSSAPSRPAQGELDRTWDTITVTDVSCSYGAQSMSFTRPEGTLADGRFHQLAISYNFAADASYIAIDGVVVRSAAGSFSGSFAGAFCNNGAGAGSIWSLPAGGKLDEVVLSDRQWTAAELITLGIRSSRACPDPTLSTYGQSVAAVSPLAYWSLDGADSGPEPTNGPVACRYGRPTNSTFGPGASDVASERHGVTAKVTGPVLSVPDQGLASTASIGWWFALPSDTSVTSVRLLAAGGGATTVDLSSSFTASLDTFSINTNACPYHGASMSYKRPQGTLADGKFHHVAIGYNIAAEATFLAIDGTVVARSAGEFTNSFMWRFCGNGAGSGTIFSTAQGGAIDEPVLVNRVLTDTEISLIGTLACPGYIPRLDGAPQAQVCGSVQGLSLKGISSGKYLGPLTQDARSQIGVFPRPFIWSEDGVLSKWLFDANSLGASRCIGEPTVPTSASVTSVVQFKIGLCDNLLFHRSTQVGAARTTLTRPNNTTIVRNWNEIIPAETPPLSSCIEEVNGTAQWAYCGLMALERGKVSFEFDKSIDTPTFADIVSNPTSPQIAAVGKFITKGSAAGTASLIQVPISRTSRVVLLVTAQHNFDGGGNDGGLFVPGATSFYDSNGVQQWKAPFGVFAVNRQTSSNPLGGGVVNDVAFATLSRQLVPPNGQFSNSQVTQLIDDALRLTTGPRASALSNVMNVPSLRLFESVPGQSGLVGSFVVGYPHGLFSGSKMMITANSPKPRTVGSARLVTFQGGMSGGASGGPMYTNGFLVGVFTQSTQGVFGGPELLNLITPLRTQHRPLLNEAICLAQQLPRTCRS
jgi:Concanavalin A-like lectin/glucanases superfamily